ncbi:MAG TPA: hypothetical protein VMH33_13360 [Solirubrobacterales bacterium]|nr:hypothetical protein [Solirubrobacterales bacterium]
MRDFLLNETLRRLATEVATRFNAMVAEGEQIPFDVAADTAEDSPFYSYVPQTGRYVAERAEQLHALPGWSRAREAVVEAGVAAAFLEARGETVPAEPGARAERMLEVFFVDLFAEGSGFALDRERLEESLATLDAEARSADDSDVLIVPLVGLRMSTERLQLPDDIRIVRADQVEAPVDAMRSEGMGRAAWEPQFLAVAEQGADGAEGALERLRELISVMRMFKVGGIGLGPFAFAPTGEDTWRRVTTGAPATRPGGYRLSEEEGVELAAFATRLERRPDPDAALTWAVGRFEMGCERESAMEGLSDHLLALRAVLEGHGPVDAALPLRAAALIGGETVDRIEARERIEEAVELERALMNGRTLERAIELATWIEDGVRGLLRQAALGELGTDLSAAADETLIATGLEAGDAEITVYAVDDSEEEEMPQIEEPTAEEFRVVSTPESPAHDESELELVYEDEDGDTRILEPIPAEGEITITATHWLDEVAEASGPGHSLEWPAHEERDLQHRERIDTPRVRHLFPVPDSNWEVSHLEYTHFGRRGGDAS